MKCGQCGNELQLGSELQLRSEQVTFRTARGVDVTIHFCSLSCVFWGGVKYVKGVGATTAPTTVQTFKRLYPGAVQ
jgi:hypothetical protein